MELTRRIDSLHISSGLPKACGDQRWGKRRKSLVLSPNRPHGPQSPNTAPQNWHWGPVDTARDVALQSVVSCFISIVCIFNDLINCCMNTGSSRLGSKSSLSLVRLRNWQTLVEQKLCSSRWLCGAQVVEGDFVKQEGRKVTGVRGNDTHSVTKLWSSSVANCWRQQPKCTHDRFSIWLFWWPGSPALRVIFWRQISTGRMP